MPCLGLTSMHIIFWIIWILIIVCVNALSRAHVSARHPLLRELPIQTNCVNALSRAHVSARRKGGNMITEVLCQCPVSGSRLCTQPVSLHHVERRIVSMPCLGLTSLHLSPLSSSSIRSQGCVNALSRAHVSALNPNFDGTNDELCQCPVPGSRLCTRSFYCTFRG